jgi:hypothetical protein
MSALADSARQFIGVKFRHRGRSRTGLDCVGLVVAAYSALGVTLPDFRLYGREPFRDGLLRHTEAAMGAPVSDGPRDGDVVVIRYNVNPHHVAIVGTKSYGSVEALTLIHAEGGIGRVIEQRLTPDVKITHVFRRPV